MKTLFVAFIVIYFLLPTKVIALGLYDADGEYVGEVVSKGCFEYLGACGVHVFVPSVGKFARVSPDDGELLDRAVYLFGNEWGIRSSETLGDWEGEIFASGNGRFRETDLLPYLDRNYFKAEKCQKCSEIFPIKTPFQYK